MTLKELLGRMLVTRVTHPDDAAERYLCHRTKRVLWVEPEPLGARSSKLAPRFLVDNGDGSRTFYSGDDEERALTRLLSPGRSTRDREPILPEKMRPPPGDHRSV